jgi:hypothetical protein
MPTVAGTPVGTISGTGMGGVVGQPPQWWINAWAAAAEANWPAAGQALAPAVKNPSPVPSYCPPWWGSPRSRMQGHPPAMAAPQRRVLRGPGTVPQPQPVFFTSRPYSRGAGAHSPKFGIVPVNPIGAGVYAPYRLPSIAGPGARYVYGAIWFDVQTIPTTIQINPTVPIDTMNALIATSRVGGTYLTTG